MNFKKMVEDARPDAPISININSFTIKNKGSIMKLNSFYIDFYNDLIEKWGLKCTETSFTKNDLDSKSHAMLWNWVAYKNIDNFARVNFTFFTNAYRVSGDTVMGIFGIKYNLELDYNQTWRKNSFTKMILPIYLRTNYQSKFLTYAGVYIEELNKIKNRLMERLNMNVYD
jgi:hypothetical protein